MGAVTVSASVPIDPNWPLLLLPGTLCDVRVFGRWFDAMAGNPAIRGRAVLPIDMTGGNSVGALAARVLDRAPDCFIPVGFSLGGIVALELARIAPSCVGAMVLVAANARDVPARDHAARRAAAMGDAATLVGDTLWPRSVAPARLGDAALRGLIADMARAAPSDTLAMQTEVAVTRRDQRPFLPDMTMPALVLGGALDLIAPSALQAELADGLPNATLHIAPDAGHFLTLERPDFCAQALTDWLALTPALH